jgi:dipeptidyl aminopeptidase/acylaminoacyl peptidase
MQTLRFKFASVIGGVTLFVIAAQAQVQPGAWTPELSMKVRGIEAVVPSPDGRMVAYAHGVLTEPGKSRRSSQIFLTRSDGSGRVQLTRDEAGASSPSFSPDGRFVYFMSKRSGKANLWRIPVDGGEAERLTDWQGDLDGYQLSPDGKWIALSGHDAIVDETKTEPRRRPGRVVGEEITNDNLWVVAAEPDASGRRALRRIVNAPYHVANFDWSPDSRYIAFEHEPDSGEDSWPRSDVSEVDIASGKVKVVANGAAGEGEPHFSPDGRYLAYVRTADKASWAGSEQIVLVPRQGGDARTIPDTFDAGPALAGGLSLPGLLPRKAMGVVLGWSADSKRILFAGEKRTRFVLYSVSVDGLTRAVYIPEGVVHGATLNATGTHIGFVQESSTQPPEAFVMSLQAGKPVQVTTVNADLPKLPLGETKAIRWASTDGLEIEGLLTLPVNYQAGKRYPLLVVIHGGPMGWWNESFIAAPGIYPLASFAAKGYAVLRPNIRGSGGYGKTFRFANVNDWGGKDYQDLMAGVDRLISDGVADPERMAVMGWSYGGYMTAWVITHTHRFKAAVVGAGPINLWSFTGSTDIISFMPYYLSGEAWEKLTEYLEHSPLYHVKGVATPTLILHGEADLRVPVSQGYELYHALQRQGVTTQLVVYPGMTHGPGDPAAELDLMERHLEWVERYVR